MRPFAASIAMLACACGRLAFDPVGMDAATTSVRPCQSDVTIFCDDFEQRDLARWAVTGAVIPVAAPTHTGIGAAQASIADAPEYAELEITPAVLAQLARLSIRTWVYVPQASSIGHINFITLRNSVSGQEITLLFIVDRFGLYRRTSAELSYNGPLVTHDQWTCVELDVDVDDAAGSVEVRVDGTPVIADPATDTLVNGGFDQLKFGMPFSQLPEQIGAATIYVDDFHLGSTAVGCS